MSLSPGFLVAYLLVNAALAMLAFGSDAAPRTWSRPARAAYPLGVMLVGFLGTWLLVGWELVKRWRDRRDRRRRPGGIR